MSQRVRALRGFPDGLPDDAGWWRRLMAVAESVMDGYGYTQLRLPVLEATELFARSVGEVTDIVEKEMFSFVDRQKTSMSLRPEGTAGCVRAGIDHGLLHNQQQRLWYAGPMFRHERPQAGRYRQFEQIGVEAYGMPGPDIDLEVIALSARILRDFGVLGEGSDLRLELNTLGDAAARQRYREALVDYLSAHRAALDEDSLRRLDSNPLRILDSKVPSTQEILRDAPAMSATLDAESLAHFEALCEALDALEISYQLNPRLVRGLDYYTRTVFEWTTDALGAQGTVCAGGRYDGLVALLGGGEVPAVGFAMGLDRVILLAKALRGAAAEAGAAPDLYLCWVGEALLPHAAALAERLRGTVTAGRPLRVLLNAGGGKLKAQLRRADRSGAALALILGEQELADGQVQIKPLGGAGAQQAVGLAEAPAAVAAALARD